MQKRVSVEAPPIPTPCHQIWAISQKIRLIFYDQRMGDQFTLKICLEMDPHFWTKSIKIMKFYVGLVLKVGLIASSGLPLPQTERVRYAPMQRCTFDNFSTNYTAGGREGGREMFSSSKGGGTQDVLSHGDGVTENN